MSSHAISINYYNILSPRCSIFYYIDNNFGSPLTFELFNIISSSQIQYLYNYLTMSKQWNWFMKNKKKMYSEL